MMSAISQSHSTLSSYAFFISPNFRLVNVTCRWAVGGQVWLSQGRPRSLHLQAAGRSPCLGSPHVRVTQLCPQEPLVWGRNRPAPHGQDTAHSPLAEGRGLRVQWKHLCIPVLGTMTGQGGRTERLPALPLGSEDGRIRAWKRGVPRWLEACPWLVGRGTGQPSESRVLRAAGRCGFPFHDSLQTRFLQEALSEWLQGMQAEVSALPQLHCGPQGLLTWRFRSSVIRWI